MNRRVGMILSQKLTSCLRTNDRALPRNTLALLVLMSCQNTWAEDYFEPELLSLGAGGLMSISRHFPMLVGWGKVAIWSPYL